ncbi:hypothetical protein MNBD_DELTA02-350 [hydrothermal vent metagenome]|uniref:Response regulatory domain-containing protein n=1 Tax=hydrothermal vent metagenome TaxID=652676 RepID=A0A3B0VP16_9ZZZZ
MDKLKVLAIEDDEEIIRLFRLALPPDIFELKDAGNGEAGLKSYEGWRPDIILLDIMLPLTTGYAVLQTIRKDLADTETAIIMSTSLGKKEDIVDCMKYGIQGYLIKPYNHRNITVDILNGYGKLHPERAKEAIESYKDFLVSQKKEAQEKPGQ